MMSYSIKLFSLFPLFFSLFSLSIAGDTISAGQSLSGDQTILSKGRKFVLGFFSCQVYSTSNNSSTNHYIGIWFKQVPTQTLIWVANRDSPVSDPYSSELTISQDGNIVLLNESKSPIWSSNLTQNQTNTSLVATILDTGNLVLTDRSNSSNVIWQIFDHPTDTLMADEWIGINKITGEYQSFVSWRNPKDPAPGTFARRVDPFGSGQYVLLWNNSKIYWYFGQWLRGSFTSIPGMPFNTDFGYDYHEDEYVQRFRYTVRKGPNCTRVVISVNGQLQRLSWSNSSNQWILQWSIPQSLCDVYSSCGAFGVCDLTSSDPLCTCLPGFEPAFPIDWNLQSWSGGCVRKSNLNCSNGKDGFVLVSNLRVPTEGSGSLQVRNREECESACLNNCSCNAYAYKLNQCLVWNSEMRNIKQVSSGNSEAVELYLHLVVSDIPVESSKRKSFKVALLAAGSGGVLSVLGFFLVLAWRYHKRRVTQGMETSNGYLNLFNYKFLQHCTKNFSQKLGEGSFGSVFKGELPDSTQIAVKRLEGLRQGEKQFRTEVSTLGNIQHVNLIRLCGFCLKGAQRMLVYDFMPNGSLDSHLFHLGFKTLDWKTRFRIVLGVARGLAYLHEECREQIVHCDIKPENILLDKDFTPIVSDFGMAKLIGRDFGQALTTTRGTIGYLAPEWILGLPITPKADVYSFGMMLFEVISGRRNRELRKNLSIGYFPVWAAISVRERNVLALLDERLKGDANLDELDRVCKVACWCIQDRETHRPTMGQVVQILEGSQSVGVAPVPRSLEHIACEHYNINYIIQSNSDLS